MTFAAVSIVIYSGRTHALKILFYWDPCLVSRAIWGQNEALIHLPFDSYERYYWFRCIIRALSVSDCIIGVTGIDSCETHQYTIDSRIFCGQDAVQARFDWPCSSHGAMSPQHIHFLQRPSTSSPNMVFSARTTTNSSFIYHCLYRIRL